MQTTSPFIGYHRSGWLGHQVRFRERVGSTNDWALELSQQGADEGLVCLTEQQTSGRGRLNRRWLAPAGTCLLMSLLFRPRDPFQFNAGRLAMICGLALLDAIKKHSSVPAVLKWPNDVIVDRAEDWRKLAGMLSEVGLLDGKPSALVVGIGLNVNVPIEDVKMLAPNAASLLAEGGKHISRLELLDTFLSSAEKRIETHRHGEDVLEEWKDNLAWFGQQVVVTSPTTTTWGKAESVDGDGALILRLDNGETVRFTVGDVSVRSISSGTPG